MHAGNHNRLQRPVHPIEVIMRTHVLRILSSISVFVSVLALSALSPAPASAQGAWDAPSFFSPRPGEDIGVYAFKPQGSDWGVSGIWRQEGNLNLGVRVGVLDDNTVLVGSEFYKPLRLSGSSILASYMLGAGASFNGDFTRLRIPFGVSIGADLGQGSGIRILPYVHPRIALDYASVDLGNGDERSDTEFPFDLDIGADIPLGSEWVIHAGGTVTHGGVYGVGLAYRMSRKLVVR
jgi:hypothetical protein